jgi:5-deoxy-glucuronate isomerase
LIMKHHRTPSVDGTIRLSVTPSDAGWDYLSFAVVELADGRDHIHLLDDQETAIVPLSGSGTVRVGDDRFDLARTSVFDQMPHVLYAPPGTPLEITGTSRFEFAIGSAPAEGRYPVRLFTPTEMTSEIRGGGAASRQVNHILAPPLPAERLLLYEVYVPRGTWSGWAPHCHDGRDGSPYLEETYLFRLDPDDGFAIHRNWRADENFDEHFTAHDRDVVLVTKGYHSSVACPSSHMFFLNFLAGELVDDQRRTPPCFHEAYTWIQDDWEHEAWELPVVGP